MTWDHPPVARTREQDYTQMRRVPAGGCWRVVVTATRFACRHQHWTGQRTLPCLAPESVCPWCERGQSKWFAAFLGCFNLSTRTPMVLSVPEDAYHAAAAIVGEDLRGRLRGWRLEFSRPAGGKRGALQVASLGREEDAASIPPHLDVPRILFRVWGLPRPASAAAAVKMVADM